MAGLDYDDIKEQLNWYSGSVSTAVRTTSFGVIGAIWAMFTAQGLTLTDAGLFNIPTNISVKMSFIFASGALLTDILQYVSAYWATSICVDKFEAAREQKLDIEFYYNNECLGPFGHFLYKFSFILFPTKLFFAISSALSFVILAFGVSWMPS